jgi:cytoskeletal protein CcmA (bactofilin family)
MSKGLEYKNAPNRHLVWLRLLAALVVALAGWLAVPKVARADWSIVGDKVPADQVIDNDVLATGTDVVIDGTINGDLWAIGSTVTVNGPVSGSLVAVGRTVTLNGEVGGSAYVVGRTLNMGGTATVVNDLHFAGLLLDSRPGSRMGRDLGVATLRARISGQVGRTLNGFILLMTFTGQIGGDTGQPGAGGTQGRAPILRGPLVGLGGIPHGLGFGLSGGSLQIMTTSLASLGPAQQEGDTSAEASAGFPDWLVARLTDLVMMLLVGGLVLWLRPVLIQHPAEWLRRKPLSAVGFGLLAVLLVVPAVIVAILLVVLLLLFGIWLGSAGFWTLAFVLWGVGYPALFLAIALSAVTILYGSKVIVADLVGSLILKRLAPGVMKYRILPLVLGLVLYVLLRTIPYAGSVIEAIVTILGLGAIWVAVRRRQRQSQAVAVDEQVHPALAPES